MCGIVGYLRLDGGAGPSQAEIDAATDTLAHRGPDGRGTRRGDGWAIGHRRLSIIDLSPAGAQPMENEDGSLLLSYNGEVYNHLDLRRDLEARGHRFRSRTDSEVLLHGHEEHGPSFVERLNGIFAYAIFEPRTRRLFLARDRFGVKPLYVAHEPGKFLAFASEPKALLALPGIRAEVDTGALREYLTFQNVFSDRTLFRGIRIVPPGTVIEASAGGVRTRRYWRPRFEPDDGLDIERAAIDLRETFRATVRRQLMSDVPLGAYLSGGLDSGSIVAMASAEIPLLKTFTGGFDLSLASGMEAAFDERAEAELVASAFGTEHYERVMHAGDMQRILPEIAHYLEDPRVGMCWHSYYVARLASRFVKVVLSGVGGDELFGGYPWRFQQVLSAPPDRFADSVYGYWQRLVPEARHAEFFDADLIASTNGASPRAAFDSLMERLDDPDPLHRYLLFEIETFLHGLLVVEDRVSMAHSLESRVPFLDNDLVALALRLPPEARFEETSGVGKVILRRAMRGVLPDAIVDRRKQGFSPPDESWFRGPTLGYVRDVVLDPSCRDRGYWKAEAVEKVVSDHMEGRANNRLLLWSLMILAHWFREYIDA